MNQRTLSACAIVLFSIGALAGFVAISERYPFYFIWDMDHLTTLDLLLINSRMLPDHINHTGVGMYLIMRITSLIARAAGILSTFRLEDVASALNPLLPIAEITTFLRLNSPVVILMGALASFAGVQAAARMPLASIGGVAVLLALLSQTWQVYHAAMIRTEVYAIFLWQLALLAIFLTVRFRSYQAQLACAVTAGLLLGLAFMTKFQLFPYLVAFYFLAKIAFDFQEERFDGLRDAYQLAPYRIALLNVFSMLVFAVLLYFAWKEPLSPGYFIVADDGRPPVYRPNFAAVTFFALSLALAALGFVHRRVSIVGRLIKSHDLILLSAVQAGYACASAVVLAVFWNLTEQFAFVLDNFKVAYLRQFVGPGPDATMDMMRVNVRQLVDNYKILLIVTVTALAITLLLAFIAPDSRERRKCMHVTLAALGIISIFLVGSVFFRFIVRDIIWHEALPTLLATLLLATAGGVITRSWPGVLSRQVGAAVTIGPLFTLVVANVIAYPTIMQKTDLNFNVYGWSAGQEFRSVYDGNQRAYNEIIGRRFPGYEVRPGTLAGMAFGQALDRRRVLRTAQYVLPYQHVQRRLINVFANGASTGNGERLISVPDRYSGGTVVDIQRTPFWTAPRIDAQTVNEHSESYYKIGRDLMTPGTIGIVPRADLDIVLLASHRDASADCPLATTLQYAGQDIRLCGERIERYTELQPLPTHRYLLVIRPTYGSSSN